jgi:carboxymethylenebutenolidase
MRKLAVLLLLAACATQTPSRLETTPRHDEWVKIGDRLHAYVVYPQTSKKAGAVMVIHENRGLTDWVRTVADEIAERGYIAIAPDLLSGAAPNGGRTSDFPTSDAAREAISKLPREQVVADLAATANYVRTLPAANGARGHRLTGRRTHGRGDTIDNVAIMMPFYGTGPSADEGVTGIEAPVYGFTARRRARERDHRPDQNAHGQHGKN